MNSRQFNVMIISDGVAYVQSKTLERFMADLNLGRQDSLEEWVSCDDVYDPFDFKVTALKFNDKMELLQITMKVDE
jgi:hypothetical protein